MSWLYFNTMLAMSRFSIFPVDQNVGLSDATTAAALKYYQSEFSAVLFERRSIQIQIALEGITIYTTTHLIHCVECVFVCIALTLSNTIWIYMGLFRSIFFNCQ